MKKLLLLLSLCGILASCAKHQAPINDVIPEHDSLTITSTLVHEDRVINVWTPPSYATSSDSFPVLYMADGGIKEDFPHIANTLAQLIAERKIPPYILVGIENTDRRRDLSGSSQVAADEEYCPLTDGAKNFRAFIAEELIPNIDSTYRTQEQKAIIGESLSGLFVMETFFLQQSLFDTYIAMDPSLWWNDQYLVNNTAAFLENAPQKQTKLWFAGSSAHDISIATNELADILKTIKHPTLMWTYSDEPNEQHNTIFRATKEKALIWALNK
jgi:predicted alpha/beta superfamily hydrolase